MNRKNMRKTVILIGSAVILLIAACLIVGYFALGANLKQIQIPSYVITTRIGDRYEFALDTERMIWEQHLPSPPASELSKYPEIAAIRSLDLYVTEQGGTYTFETVSTANDPNLSRTLRNAGVVLKNTQWTWTESDIIGSRATQPSDGFVVLSLPEFCRVSQKPDGSFDVTVDHDAMLEACAFALPLDPELHSGYRAIRSLSIGMSRTETGYRMQAQSGLPTIMEMLAENRVRITDTTWEWTQAELTEKSGAAQPAESAQPAATESPAPTQQPSGSTSADGAITTLKGFDQTAVRTAIRDAKLAYYGSKFESGSILSNVFAVGKAGTAHKNVFRIVYDITSADGPEYLVADVYDLAKEDGYTTGDVHLKTYASRAEARATTDLADYTLYNLTGGSMVFPENAGVSPFDENGFVLAHSISTALTYNELWDIPQTNEFTLLQLLAFARNEMFARAGHPFDVSGIYYKHFSEYDWYEPGATVSAGELAERWPSTAPNTTTIKFIEKLIREG